MESNNDLEVDKEEYQSVFKVFDKNDEGKIHISQVNDFIAKFEQIKVGNDGSNDGNNKGDFGNSAKTLMKGGYAQPTQS